MRPFLKWAGNKYALLTPIRAVLPVGERLVEPFAGSGAVFLNTDYKSYLLCDTNRDLISLYTILQKDGEAFIGRCRELFDVDSNHKDVFLKRRQLFNSTRDKTEKAALFVYLNRHGYNGLCRYNSKKQFNVPFGRYDRPKFPEKEMRDFFEKSQRAEFRCQPFGKTLSTVRAGDVVYCDPPYVPLSKTASFVAYESGGFTLRQQKALGKAACRLADQGIPVLISNHDTDFTRATYDRAIRVDSLDVRRSISCKGKQRGKAPELLAFFA